MQPAVGGVHHVAWPEPIVHLELFAIDDEARRIARRRWGRWWGRRACRQGLEWRLVRPGRHVHVVHKRRIERIVAVLLLLFVRRTHDTEIRSAGIRLARCRNQAVVLDACRHVDSRDHAAVRRVDRENLIRHRDERHRKIGGVEIGRIGIEKDVIAPEQKQRGRRVHRGRDLICLFRHNGPRRAREIEVRGDAHDPDAFRRTRGFPGQVAVAVERREVGRVRRHLPHDWSGRRDAEHLDEVGQGPEAEVGCDEERVFDNREDRCPVRVVREGAEDPVHESPRGAGERRPSRQVREDRRAPVRRADGDDAAELAETGPFAGHDASVAVSDGDAVCGERAQLALDLLALRFELLAPRHLRQVRRDGDAGFEAVGGRRPIRRLRAETVYEG